MSKVTFRQHTSDLFDSNAHEAIAIYDNNLVCLDSKIYCPSSLSSQTTPLFVITKNIFVNRLLLFYEQAI